MKVVMIIAERLNIYEDQRSRAFFDNSFLKLLFCSMSELDAFVQVVGDVADRFPSIDGILLTGTMTQQVSLPHPDELQPGNGSDTERAYGKISNLKRRKIAPHPDSDLDIWICSRTDLDNDGIVATTTERALTEIEWLSSNLDLHGSPEWIARKISAFGEFYKNPQFYSETDLGENPWMAHLFVQALIAEGARLLPDLVAKANHYFLRGWTEDLLEVRAYPPGVFNVRPERIRNENNETIDRSPFAYYLPDWVELGTNCLVIYRHPELDIYPFSDEGRVLGQEIVDKVQR